MGMDSLITAVGYMIFLHLLIPFFYSICRVFFIIYVMGRVVSIYGFIEAFLIITVTVIFGIFSELISIRFVVVSRAFVIFLISIIYLFAVSNHQKQNSILIQLSLKIRFNKFFVL